MDAEEGAESPTKGRMATCYLGRQYREAMDKAVAEKGWLHHQYVKVAMLEKLIRDGAVSQSVLDVELEKIEFRKFNPHGNSKRAKLAGASTNTETGSRAPAVASPRKLTPTERREIRIRRKKRG